MGEIEESNAFIIITKKRIATAQEANNKKIKIEKYHLSEDCR